MKKLNFITFMLFFVLSTILLTRCGEGSNKIIGSINQPFKNFTLPVEKIIIDAIKGGLAKMKNGTTIEVPPMAFVDDNGKAIETPVTINYEQFQSAAEVMACGIPMNYDSAGTTIHFETAGMFQINATTTDNKKVQIASGKTLEVNMATNVEGSQFNFYTFDEQKGNWVYLGHNDPKPNEEKKELVACVKECDAPITPQASRKNAPVFDLNVDYNLYPELKAFQQTLWQCAPGCTEDEKNTTVANLQKNFDNIKLEQENPEQNVFKLTLYNSNGKFSTNICPVVKEKDMATATAEYAQKYAAYQKTVKEEKQKVVEANLMGNLYRSFAVANFGTYNWDCQLKQPNVMKCSVNCRFDGDVNPRSLTYYLISSKEKKVVYYSYDDFKERFALNPDVRNKILCVLNGSQLSVATIDEMPRSRNKVIDCYFETLPLTITSVDDLDNFIKSF